MKSETLRQKFLDFFERRGHTVVPSSSLIPDDPSVLLTTAGMQQFKPYFVGTADPMKDFGSRNTVSVQKSFRTSDIDEVGDESHLTFFEMLGNFSFGGPDASGKVGASYFKKGAIEYAHEFITQELGLKIDYVSVFAGDKEVPADAESEALWKAVGITNIKRFGRADNFWGPTGSEGPCGPTTEIYVNSALRQAQGKPPVEVWNIVFNEYYCHADKRLEKLKTPGVDTGMGLERLAMVAQGKKNIFETDLFSELISVAPQELDERKRRIFADHARGISFLVSDGVVPSNKEAGYILRRLMRRLIFFGGADKKYDAVFETVCRVYGSFYRRLKKETVISIFGNEKTKFETTLSHGLRELGKLQSVDARSAFRLYESFGIPFEVIKEHAREKASLLRREDFDAEFTRHQKKSRAGKEKKFGGHGLLLDTGELKAADEAELKKVTRLHTATHMLQQALRDVLGPGVTQMGSDITAERTRFDFAFSRKLTAEEKKRVEEIVNNKISENTPVRFEEMAIEDAKKTGALYYFREKYPDKVKVYYIGKSLKDAWSKEFCGGPHVSNTGDVGVFKIAKEEATGAGVRRMRGVVSP